MVPWQQAPLDDHGDEDPALEPADDYRDEDSEEDGPMGPFSRGVISPCVSDDGVPYDDRVQSSAAGVTEDARGGAPSSGFTELWFHSYRADDLALGWWTTFKLRSHKQLRRYLSCNDGDIIDWLFGIDAPHSGLTYEVVCKKQVKRCSKEVAGRWMRLVSV